MPKADKAQLVERLAEEMSRSPLVVLTDYRGLTVAQMHQLRRQMAQVETRMEVAKNTLLKRAADQIGVEEGIGGYLEGPTAVAFVHGDIAAAAKTLKDYARTSRVFSVKGAIFGKRVLAAERVDQLAELPSKDVMIARAIGGIQAPIVGLVTVLGGPVRGLVNVLQARKEQLASPQGG